MKDPRLAKDRAIAEQNIDQKLAFDKKGMLFSLHKDIKIALLLFSTLVTSKFKGICDLKYST